MPRLPAASPSLSRRGSTTMPLEVFLARRPNARLDSVAVLQVPSWVRIGAWGAPMAGGEDGWVVKGGGKKKKQRDPKPCIQWGGGHNGATPSVGDLPWTCGACGTGSNWPTRTCCRACGRLRTGKGGKVKGKVQNKSYTMVLLGKRKCLQEFPVVEGEDPPPYVTEGIAQLDRDIAKARNIRDQAKPLVTQMREAQALSAERAHQEEVLVRQAEKLQKELAAVQKAMQEARQAKAEAKANELALQAKIAAQQPTAPASDLDVLRVQLEATVTKAGDTLENMGFGDVWSKVETLITTAAAEGDAGAEHPGQPAGGSGGKADEGSGGGFADDVDMPDGVTEEEKQWVNGLAPAPDPVQQPERYKRFQERKCWSGCTRPRWRRRCEWGSSLLYFVLNGADLGYGVSPWRAAVVDHLRRQQRVPGWPGSQWTSEGWIPLSEGSERARGAEVNTTGAGWAGYAQILQDPTERHLLIPRPIEVLEENCDDGARRRARHVHAFQEHRLLDEAWAGVTGSMKACGCQIGGAAAVPTVGREGEPGTSAGVGFAVPKDMGAAYPFGQTKWDASPKGSAGRAATAWIAAGRGGMLIATVYLWAAEGLSNRNIAIVTGVVEFMESLGMPWVIRGDVQDPPGVLAEVKAIKQAEAMLVAPTTVVKVVLQEGWASAPRKPVGLTLGLSVQVKRARALQKPRDLDDVIIGCAPEPPSYARTLGNLMGAYDRFHSKSANAGPITQRLVDVLAQERLFNLSGAARNRRMVGQALLEEARAMSKRFDQDLVNERRKEWAAKLESAAQAPRPWELEPRMELNGFNDGDFDRLKKVARSFKKKTAMGSDRVWEIMRGPYLQAWARENHRSWGCTSYGRAAEDAAWEVLLAHEAGAPGGADPAVTAAITAILDLAQAFERVSLHVLWERGKRMGFHTGVLAVVCSCFAMARRVSTGGAVSLETRTVCTIIAGSKFSEGFLEMVIQGAVGGLVVEHPLATWRMHVGDLSIRQRGAQQWVADVFPVAIDDSFASFAELGLEFSVGAKGKCAVMASAKWLRDTVQGDMSQRGRTARLLQLRRGGKGMARGMGLVYKCELKRSVLHGCKCLGMPDHQLQQVRRAAGKPLPGPKGAKSLTLQLALAKEEPTREITAAPVRAGHAQCGSWQWVKKRREQRSGRPSTSIMNDLSGKTRAVDDVAALDEALGVWAALWITDLRGVGYQDVGAWLEWATVLVGVRYEGATQAEIAATCRRSWARARWRRAAAIRYISNLDYVDRVEVLKQCRYERVAVRQVLRRLLGDRLRRVPDDGERQLEAGSGCHNIGSLGELLDLFVQVGRQSAISEERVSERRRGLSERDDLQEQLQRAWKQQQIAVGMQPQWGRVKGNAGAVIMSIRRAGWTWSKWHTFLMRNGEQLNLLETCPNDVGMLLQQDLEAQLWAQWAAEPGHESLAPAPFLQPARALVVARNFPKHAKNAARKVLLCDSWAMSKLCEHNITPTDICLACGEAVGTPHHRCYVCPKLRDVRNKGQADWQHVAEQQVDSLLWTRGLVRDPPVDWQFRAIAEEQYHFVVNEGSEAHLTGDIMCDGSKMGGSEWAQAGWAAMAINGEGAPTVQLWGPLPRQYSVQKTVKRSEMWAFLKVLEVVMPPCRIYTDHQGIVDGLIRGARWCLSWKRPRADLWRRIWHKVVDVGLDRSCVGRVKAHRSKTTIDRLEGCQQAIARGNAAVDLLAKSGAEDDYGYGRQEVLDRLGEKVRWAIHNVGWWHQQLNGEWPDVLPPPPGPRRRRQQQPHIQLTKHEVEQRGRWQVRARCGRRAATARMRKKLWEAECRPPPWRMVDVVNGTADAGSLE
ncbi:unnamed protein product, partial [Prorocentrum cordatum]